MVSVAQRSGVSLWLDMRGAVQQNKQHIFDLQSTSARDGRLQEDVFQKISDGLVGPELLLSLWKRSCDSLD